MADYHFSVTQIKRSAGQSAIASAAYRAGEKLHSDYYGEDSDYTKKIGVVFSDIILPANAPTEYSDRETLWNAVEKAEKHPKAQLAYSFDFSLQNEFSMEENMAIAREFIQKYFVDRGMIADYAIHLPEKRDGGTPNPHVHVMCPIRPLNPDGTWGAKQKRVYHLNEDGKRIRDDDGKELFDAVSTTDWGKPETLEYWRKAWAEINNAHFSEHGLSTKIDNRSFARQGIPQLPTIHEGPHVRKMEMKGIVTEKGERNHWIRHINISLRSLSDQLKKLIAWIKELKEKISAAPEPTVTELLVEYFTQRNEKAWSFMAKTNNLKELTSLIAYLEKYDIQSVSDLEEHINQVNRKNEPMKSRFAEIHNRISELDKIEKVGERYERSKPFYEEWYGFFFKKSKDKYASEHKKQLNTYHASRKQLINSHFLNANGDFDSVRLTQEREKYLHKLGKIEDEYRPQLEQVSMLKAIQKAISSVSEEDIMARATTTISSEHKTNIDSEISELSDNRNRFDLSV